MQGSRKNGPLRAGDAGRRRGRHAQRLLALAAIVVFLTYPADPFVIQHARRPLAP
jgi:hypothetical protein